MDLPYRMKDRIVISAQKLPWAIEDINRELAPAQGRHKRDAGRDFVGKKSGGKRMPRRGVETSAR
jgi:hypothetical protein